ncbi:MAG: single-stranded DNA-binding protein [Victivallaceae bacterium]|nr:single-stranded DNA-binding protein [Victivallaceae bacterium]
MASLNKVFLLGNLTRTPELRYTPSGSAVCEFGLAVSRRFQVNNQDREEVCFVEIIVWGKPAESCKNYLDKGSPALIEGRLQYDQWEDRDGGGKRSKLRVVADRVQFVGGRRGDGAQMDGEMPAPSASQPQGRGGYAPRSEDTAPSQQPQPQQQRRAPEPPVMPEGSYNPSDIVDDIPF